MYHSYDVHSVFCTLATKWHIHCLDLLKLQCTPCVVHPGYKISVSHSYSENLVFCMYCTHSRRSNLQPHVAHVHVLLLTCKYALLFYKVHSPFQFTHILLFMLYVHASIYTAPGISVSQGVCHSVSMCMYQVWPHDPSDLCTNTHHARWLLVQDGESHH